MQPSSLRTLGTPHGLGSRGVAGVRASGSARSVSAATAPVVPNLMTLLSQQQAGRQE